MTSQLDLYHKFPPILKDLAASVRGYHLRSWRYSRETEQLIELALERQSWSQHQWSAWQQERLFQILRRAAMLVPYYREMWQKKRQSGDRASWEYLENWPVLTKEPLRANPYQFIAEDKSPRSLFRDQTSGTTGTPIQIFISRDALRQWYALFEARTRRWHGVSYHQHWAIMGGQMVVPIDQKTPPYWVHNWAMRQLYLSTHHISPATVEAYLNALRAFMPTHMVVYPSSAALLASYIEQLDLPAPSLQVIFSNAENLLESQRTILQKIFRCPVVNTYGMGEYLFGAGECTQGKMHAWPEAGMLEVMQLEADKPVQEKETGRIILTSLINPDMPLIRYETGDLGSSLGYEPCSCGCSLPLLGSIEGRLNDMILTPDGRKVFWINPIYYGLPVREAQIIQIAHNLITIQLIPDAQYDDSVTSEILARVKQRLGAQMNARVILVDHIPRTRGGKFKSVIAMEQINQPENSEYVES